MKVIIEVINSPYSFEDGIDLPCIPPVGSDISTVSVKSPDEWEDEFGEMPWMRVRDTLWDVFAAEPYVTLYVDLICPETDNAEAGRIAGQKEDV